MDLVKTGNKTLTLNGNVTTANSVVAQEGTLALNGSANSIGTLNLASSADGGAKVVIRGITTASLADDAAGGSLEIASGGTLKTTGDSTLDRATSISGAGTLNVQEGSSLTLSGEAGLSGTSVTLNGTLSLDGTGDKSILRPVRFRRSGLEREHPVHHLHHAGKRLLLRHFAGRGHSGHLRKGHSGNADREHRVRLERA